MTACRVRVRTLAALVIVSVLALVVVPTTSAAATTVPSGFTDALVASGLTSPTAFAIANDGRVFVAEQSGAIKVIKNGAVLPTPFTKLTVAGGGGPANEDGLLGLTLDPNFATNHLLYVYYTVPTAGTVAAHNRVSRFVANGDVAGAGSQKTILDLAGPSSGTHNGGAIHFGVDGKLYVAVGDHGVSANAQAMSTVKGKLLRLNPDGSFPHDNPFFNTTTGQNRAIWALGLRNPSRFAVQPGTGMILVNDVGSDGLFEEINLGVAGANYGWNLAEGPTSGPGLRSPLFAYPHQAPGAVTGCAIGGGAFYNPTTVMFPSSYIGKYFFADSCDGWIRVLDATGTAADFATGVGQPVDMQVGNDGALYYLDRSAGSVRRITFAPSAAPAINSHPVSVTVAVGQPASFSVSADGTPPLAYQWQRDDVDIPDATATTYTVPSAASSDSGASFRAVVTNATGTATSNRATLTVTDVPTTVDLEFETSPPGLQVTVDGSALATPASIASVVGATRTIGVVSPQTLNGQSYVFSAWSQGGAATQVVQTPAADTDYIASFVPSAGGTGDFSDAFNRPDAPDLGTSWITTSGALSISGQELRSAPTKNLFQMAIVPTFSGTAPTVAADFARTDSNSLARFGLVLRYQDPQNYYLAARRTGGSSVVQISKVLNGIETVLATKSLPNPALNTFFHLEALANGTTLTIKVDGVALLSATDATFTTGNVGIGLGSMSTSTAQAHRADNFSASGSDGTTVPPPPPPPPTLTLTLTATPTNVAVGGSSTLSWSTSGADACTFTSGQSGARPVSGSESTGALASTTSFGMTCTGASGSVSKSVNVTVGAPPTTLPTAVDVHTSQAMVLPSSVRAFVFLVPNESHHQDITRNISATNGYLLPMRVTLPTGATMSVVSADNGHHHTLNLRNGTTQVATTGDLVYGSLSAPVTLGPGSYSLIDTTYPWIHGDITVGDPPSDGTLLVGAFFLPQKRLADYHALFPANGFRIESEHTFSYGGTVQVLLVFSTDESLSTAGPKLQALVRANSYG